ncbi:hypothetical protein [Microvirga pudoricolor]|uniref:hypothetical protein n=1 Tax=Microvirga pudoricolor TaxID=2778729 RepID=UPI00194F2AF3|nr:hypothetical protein [Microvirga pudoricolor]MBM6594840.1 hypothetical protein [Microvirga pudoricolor]
MELVSAFRVRPAEGERPGALAAFPYDRDLVRRFREQFPRARWREAEGGWFVPGTTATTRLDTWIAGEIDKLDLYADAKGRDAFVFEPLESQYLRVGEDLEVRTPYSRTVVEELRAVPFARWDPDHKVWRVPFRSYEALRGRWPVIEEAARRNEPEAKRQRRLEREPVDETALVVMAERRRRRYPVRMDEPPPLGEPVGTFRFGVVVFEAIDADPLEDVGSLERLGVYPHVHDHAGSYSWAHWRLPEWQEITWARPLREPVGSREKIRLGWWPPDQNERRERMRKLREIERAQRTRQGRSAPSEAAE